MTDPATERVTQKLFTAITDVINEIKTSGDEEGLSKIGPILLTTGSMILVQGVGIETTSKVIRELAVRVERGDFSSVPPLFDAPAGGPAGTA